MLSVVAPPSVTPSNYNLLEELLFGRTIKKIFLLFSFYERIEQNEEIDIQVKTIQPMSN
jgi:hypothetical protein